MEDYTGNILMHGMLAQQRIRELQRKTGKSFNECSSALHLADGDVDMALKIMKQYPEHDRRLKRFM